MDYMAFFKSEQRYVFVGTSKMLESHSVRSNDENGFLIKESNKLSKKSCLTHMEFLEIVVKDSQKVDQKKCLQLIEAISKAEILEVKMFTTTSFFNEKYVGTALKDKMLEVPKTIDDYNNLVEQLKKELKPLSGTVATAYDRQYDQYSYSHRREYTIKERDITLEEVLPSKYKLAASSKTAINFLVKNFDEFLSLTKSKADHQASTENTFIVYLGKRSEGYPDSFMSKNGAVPFNNAETFVDMKKAERSCSARGYHDYEIWRISSYVEEKVKTNGTVKSGEIAEQILSAQEKRAIEQMMKSEYVKDTERKLAQYEEILRQHNLLPEAAVKVVRKNKL